MSLSLPVKAARRAVEHRRRLAELFPWTKSPLIIGAPMRVFSGPAMAVAISRAGGLGFIGPGEKPESTATDLAAAGDLLKDLKDSLKTKDNLLPVGAGFQVWNGDLESAVDAVTKHRPCAVWLFAPRDGQAQLAEWTRRLRAASPGTQIWVQVGTLKEAVESGTGADAADALVLQGAEAGGHGRATDGIGLISLLPEVADTLGDKSLALIGAGGIADGRGVSSALSLGAAGVAMGTRFLASTEARINPAYQAEVVRAADGAHNTGRTHLYNHLRGTFGWPEQYSPRGLLNQSWTDQQAGVPFDELKTRYEAAAKEGGTAAWGPEGRSATYASASVGLVRDVQGAGDIVTNTLEEVAELRALV